MEFITAVWRKRKQSLHSVCSTLILLWVSANRGSKAQEIRVSLSKAWHVL